MDGCKRRQESRILVVRARKVPGSSLVLTGLVTQSNCVLAHLFGRLLATPCHRKPVNFNFNKRFDIPWLSSQAGQLQATLRGKKRLPHRASSIEGLRESEEEAKHLVVLDIGK